ncbi:MAG: hypothetical protein ACKO46_00440, partial [Alphaproteobacteria bacterium]
MGGAPGMGGSGSSTSAVKSGISIVDPEGNEFNCQPFVDKKWDSTDYADNWNGLYFGIGSEYSFFSGNFEVESSMEIDPNKYVKIPSSFLNKPVNFSGSSNSVVFNLGGGTLIDRMFLGSDMEIRTAGLSSNFNFDIEEKKADDTITGAKIKSNYSINVNLIFNAKIGYLLTERVMTYFNAGIGSFSSSNLSSSDKYSLNKFFQLINQQFIYSIYQPNKPNDKGLFKYWYKILIKQNVNIMLNTQVLTLNGNTQNKVEYI